MKKYFKVNRFKNKNNDYEGLENAEQFPEIFYQ